MRANSVIGLYQSRIGKTQRRIPALSPTKRELQISTALGRNTLQLFTTLRLIILSPVSSNQCKVYNSSLKFYFYTSFFSFQFYVKKNEPFSQKKKKTRRSFFFHEFIINKCIKKYPITIVIY